MWEDWFQRLWERSGRGTHGVLVGLIVVGVLLVVWAFLR